MQVPAKVEAGLQRSMHIVPTCRVAVRRFTEGQNHRTRTSEIDVTSQRLLSSHQFRSPRYEILYCACDPRPGTTTAVQ